MSVTAGTLNHNYDYTTLPWQASSLRTTITSLSISGVTLGTDLTDMSKWFRLMTRLDSFAATGLNTGNVTNMQSMFDDSYYLTNLTGLSGLDTGNVTNMKYMFANCTLPTLDISGWNTGNVTNMQSMLPNGLSRITIGTATRLQKDALLALANRPWYTPLTVPSTTPPCQSFYDNSSLVAASQQPGGAPGTYTNTSQPTTLKLDVNTGTGSIDDISGTTADATSLPAFTGLTKLGFKPTTWNTKANGSGDGWPAGTALYLPAGTTVLYAQWQDVPPIASLDKAEYIAGQTITVTVYDQTGSSAVEPGDTVTITWPDSTPGSPKTDTCTSGLDGTCSFTGAQSRSHGSGQITVTATDSGNNTSVTAATARLTQPLSSLPFTGNDKREWIAGATALTITLLLLAGATILRNRQRKQH